MDDEFLDEEDKDLSEDELMNKLACRIVDKLRPTIAKKKLWDLLVYRMKYDHLFFTREYGIYLKGRHIDNIGGKEKK